MKSSHRPGIRGRLFIAFGALSAVTLLVSLVSWLSYNLLGEELDHVVKGNIQTLSQMAELKEQATKITLTAPTLLAVNDETERKQVWQTLDQNISQMAELLPGIAAATPDNQVQLLLNQIEALQASLGHLDRNVLQHLKIHQQKSAENQRLRWVAASFLSDIDNLIDTLNQTLYSRFNQDHSDPWIVMNNYGEDAIRTINADLQRLYRIKADASLLINLVDRAQHLPDLNSLIATQTHSDEIIERIQKDLRAVDKLHGIQPLRQTIVNIVFLTRGENNMFTIRSQERAILRDGALLLGQIRGDLDQLNQLIAVQTGQAEAAAQSSAETAQATIKTGRIWILSMVALSLLFSILVVWLYVGRNMVARITSLDASMRAIANGNLNQQVQVKGSDEIGTMARSLVSFRDQLTTLQEELVQAGKLAALGQLSAGIAHEINQPLSAIGHYAHNGTRLLDAGRLEETGKNLNQISQLTKRATTIITRLKSLARKQQNNLIAVDIRQVVDNVLQMVENDEVRKLTRIEVNYQLEQHPAHADPVQLEQVVLNLVTNALNAIAAQEEKLIQIDCLPGNGLLEIQVSDNGPGIAAELREQIFDPLLTTKPRSQSLGLGLAISYNIIKSFNGRLTVDNQATGGASFRIQLPEYRRSKP